MLGWWAWWGAGREQEGAEVQGPEFHQEENTILSRRENKGPTWAVAGATEKKGWIHEAVREGAVSPVGIESGAEVASVRNRKPASHLLMFL